MRPRPRQDPLKFLNGEAEAGSDATIAVPHPSPVARSASEQIVAKNRSLSIDKKPFIISNDAVGANRLWFINAPENASCFCAARVFGRPVHEPKFQSHV